MSYCNEVYEITSDLFCIKDVQSINKYLIIGSEKALLFDSGFGFEDFHDILNKLTDKPIYSVLNYTLETITQI